MKKYRFKKVLLVIACFSLVIVMTACASGGSHASISTDPDNPSELTFPETAEDGTFYQSIYNSNADDPDAEPGTIYGCYQGTLDTGGSAKFIACKPKLSATISQAIKENDLKYFVIRTEYSDDTRKIAEDQLHIFKNDASLDVMSRDQKTIEFGGKCPGISLGSENDYMYAGMGCVNENFTTYDEFNEEYVLQTIDNLMMR